MDLKSAVERYLEVVRNFRRPMPLTEFGLPKEEIEAMVSAWDEDYHLHRYFELVPASKAAAGDPVKEAAYRIHGILYTGIIFHESIRHALGHDPR